MTAASMDTLLTRGLHDYLSLGRGADRGGPSGRTFILVDDEDRENEGDLVHPGAVRHARAGELHGPPCRGLVCLAMTHHRVEQLGLPLMSQANGTRHQTAFTVSIEARDGRDDRDLGA